MKRSTQIFGIVLFVAATIPALSKTAMAFTNPPRPAACSSCHGTIKFGTPSYSVNENGGAALITITRLSPSTGKVGVTLTPSNGTAIAPSDYTAGSQTVSWNSGETGSKTVNIPIINDTVVEGDETINLTLSSPTITSATVGTLSGDSAMLVSPTAAVLTIADNDRLLTVTSLNPTSGASITINSPPTDSNGIAGGGNTQVTRTYNAETAVILTANSPAPGGNIFNSWSGCDSTAGAQCSVTMSANRTVTAGYVTPLPAGSLQFSSSSYSVNESGGSAVITVTRTGGSSGVVSVTFSTSPGTASAPSDYTAVSQQVNFASGETTKTVNVPIVNDSSFEGNETVNLTLSIPTGGASLGSPSTAVLTIIDDDNAVPGSVIFHDNMENGAGDWVAQFPWAQTTTTSHSATHAWTDSPGQNYANNLNASLFSPAMDLSGFSSVTLSFWHRYDLENGFDFGNVWVTTNNGASFIQVASFTGTNASWSQASVNLEAFAGNPSVKIAFQLLSDASVTGDGWYVDDVVVSDATFAPVDFDGDGKSDIGIYRNGAWSIKRSSDGGVTNFNWGGPSWVPVIGDYDGDGITDIAVYNPNGLWSIMRSSDGGNTLIGWSGAAGDIPVPADYDGDGKADLAVYNKATAGWSIIRSSDSGLTYKAWGGPAWQPVVADYDGDGKADIAVYNPNGLWSIIRSSDGGHVLIGWSGAVGDIPVPADYDGDGKADLAVYNTVTAGWSIIRSSDSGLTYKAWGGPAWQPVVADYDGDGKADIAVYNPTNGLWSIVRSSDGGNTLVGLGGGAQDIPLN